MGDSMGVHSNMSPLYYIFLVFACSVSANYNRCHSKESRVSTIVNNKGEEIGTVKIVQAPHGVLMEVEAHSLPAGKHGMHFHAVGNCDDHRRGFKKSGGHVMPSGRPHGFLNKDGPHEGNLPNLIVNEDGTANVELYSSLVHLECPIEGLQPALGDTDGSALIIHVNQDDHFSQPIGGSGGRIACAVIH